MRGQWRRYGLSVRRRQPARGQACAVPFRFWSRRPRPKRRPRGPSADYSATNPKKKQGSPSAPPCFFFGLRPVLGSAARLARPAGPAARRSFRRLRPMGPGQPCCFSLRFPLGRRPRPVCRPRRCGGFRRRFQPPFLHAPRGRGARRRGIAALRDDFGPGERSSAAKGGGGGGRGTGVRKGRGECIIRRHGGCQEHSERPASRPASLDSLSPDDSPQLSPFLRVMLPRKKNFEKGVAYSGKLWYIIHAQ